MQPPFEFLLRYNVVVVTSIPSCQFADQSKKVYGATLYDELSNEFQKVTWKYSTHGIRTISTYSFVCICFQKLKQEEVSVLEEVFLESQYSALLQECQLVSSVTSESLTATSNSQKPSSKNSSRIRKSLCQKPTLEPSEEIDEEQLIHGLERILAAGVDCRGKKKEAALVLRQIGGVGQIW